MSKKKNDVDRLIDELGLVREDTLRDRRSVYLRDLKMRMSKTSFYRCAVSCDAWNDDSPHRATYPCKIVFAYKFAEDIQKVVDACGKVKIVCENMSASKAIPELGLQANQRFLLVVRSVRSIAQDEQDSLAGRVKRLEQCYREMQSRKAPLSSNETA